MEGEGFRDLSLLREMKRVPKDVSSRSELARLVSNLKMADKDAAAAESAELRFKALNDRTHLPLLFPLLVNSYPPSQSVSCVVRIIQHLKSEKPASKFLAGMLRSRAWKTRASAAAALECFADRSAIPALKAAFADSNETVRLLALDTLCQMTRRYPSLEAQAVSLCIKALKDRSHGVRRAAFEGLSHMKDARCDALIDKAFNDPHPDIRANADWWHKERKQVS